MKVLSTYISWFPTILGGRDKSAVCTTNYSDNKLSIWLVCQAVLCLAWGIYLLHLRNFTGLGVVLAYFLLTVVGLFLHQRKLLAQSALRLQVLITLITLLVLYLVLGGLINSWFLLLGVSLPFIGVLSFYQWSFHWSFLFGVWIISIVGMELYVWTHTISPDEIFLSPIIYMNVLVILGVNSIFLAYHLYGKRKKLKAQIKWANELELKYEAANNRVKELEKSHRKQVDGLRYAQRIQNALMPHQDELNVFFNKSFVISKPLDYVSGDFYWCSNQPKHYVLIVGDCTGHGISGGFLTMLGSSILNHLVMETGISCPSHLLRSLDLKLGMYLYQGFQGKNQQVKDGMDVAVLVFHKETNTLAFAGAKQSLWAIRDGECEEISGDRIPIGHNDRYKSKRWQSHKREYRKGDRFIISTDGFRDQFGGEKNQRLGKKQWRELLQNYAPKSFEAQEEVLSHTFYTWKGENKQTDDVMVVGIEV